MGACPRNQKSRQYQKAPSKGLSAFAGHGNRSFSHQFLKHRRLFEEARVPLTAGERQDRRQMAAQHDRQFMSIRHQFHPRDLNPRKIPFAKLGTLA